MVGLHSPTVADNIEVRISATILLVLRTGVVCNAIFLGIHAIREACVIVGVLTIIVGGKILVEFKYFMNYFASYSTHTKVSCIVGV